MRPTMQRATLIALSLCLVALAAPVPAAQPLNCATKSLANAVASAKEKDSVITFTGICAGPIVIQTDGLTLQGVGTAVIDGGGQDAVTVKGAGQVSLTAIEIRGGLHGLVALNGAHLTLSDVSVHDNLASGIVVRTGSSIVLTNVATSQNGLHGLDVQNGSSSSVEGALTAAGNS